MPHATDRSEARPETSTPCRRGLRGVWSPRGVSASGGTLLERVLAARAFPAGPERDRFLTPLLSHLHDPSLMPDLDRAAARLLDAARAGEPIVIYGDYDVDGVSATAILFHTLRAVAPEAPVRSYVPHRVEEGYGLNTEAIRELAASGARVIVTVDCGVTAVEQARVARDLGLDLIITDHHNAPAAMEDLPPAFALVHPRRPDSAYPFGDLCGAAVAYKLAWRLATLANGSPRASEPLRALLIELLGLASLGVIADVVPLLGENRVIARHGLSRIKHSTIPGLRALVEASGLGGESVDAEAVGFRLGPRLNACGRLGHAREAVELLTTATGDRAREIAESLSRLNDERRATELRIFDAARERAEAAGMTRPDRRAIVLCDEGWHPGVVGIVCSRLVERYHRPTLLLSRTGDVCHGSGRSVDGFNLHGALASCADLLTSFGGHDMAAGLKLPAERLPEFVERFTEAANAGIQADDLTARVPWDVVAGLDELTPQAVAQLAGLGPFGRENPPVALLLHGLKLAGRAETFGQMNRHLSLFVASPGQARPMRMVGWSWAANIQKFPSGAVFDAVVTPRISTWRGVASVEPVLVDAAPRG